MSDDKEGLGKRMSSRKTSAPERFASADDNVSARKQRKISSPKVAATDGPAGGGSFGGVGKAEDAPPDSASLFQKRTAAFRLHMLGGDTEKIMRCIVVPGHDQHEKFKCGMLHVIDHTVFHRDLLKMIKEDTEGIWPAESEHPTWAEYCMLRQNGFKEMYFGPMMFGIQVKERAALPGEMMWYW